MNLVPLYLIHSYLYYVHDTAVIPDAEYDRICKELLDRWNEAQAHPHAAYLDRSSLEAGTAFHIKADDYPMIVRCAAARHCPEVAGAINHPQTYRYVDGWAAPSE